MQVSDSEHFRDVLLERRRVLTEWLGSDTTIRAGDAEKVRQLLAQIKEALQQIGNGSYGACRVCHEEIELQRLEIQPVSHVCLDCISAEEQVLLEKDLYLAGQIHRALLPQTVPHIEGFDVGVQSLAAGNIGGDYYDFLPGTDDGSIRVVIADAMGHGLSAGLLMSNLQGALRILAAEIPSPGQLLTRLNQWLCRNIPVTKFISMVCVGVERSGAKQTRIAYTNAGHCLPLVIRSGGKVERFEVTGGVLGVHEAFNYEERRLTLSSGDAIVLFTDGIIEAENARGEAYDENRLIDFVRSRHRDAAVDIVHELVTSVLGFSGASQAADDLTAVILQKK